MNPALSSDSYRAVRTDREPGRATERTDGAWRGGTPWQEPPAVPPRSLRPRSTLAESLCEPLAGPKFQRFAPTMYR